VAHGGHTLEQSVPGGLCDVERCHMKGVAEMKCCELTGTPIPQCCLGGKELEESKVKLSLGREGGVGRRWF